jgi:hypothetical protein
VLGFGLCNADELKEIQFTTVELMAGWNNLWFDHHDSPDERESIRAIVDLNRNSIADGDCFLARKGSAIQKKVIRAHVVNQLECPVGLCRRVEDVLDTET